MIKVGDLIPIGGLSDEETEALINIVNEAELNNTAIKTNMINKVDKDLPMNSAWNDIDISLQSSINSIKEKILSVGKSIANNPTVKDLVTSVGVYDVGDAMPLQRVTGIPDESFMLLMLPSTNYFATNLTVLNENIIYNFSSNIIHEIDRKSLKRLRAKSVKGNSPETPSNLYDYKIDTQGNIYTIWIQPNASLILTKFDKDLDPVWFSPKYALTGDSIRAWFVEDDIVTLLTYVEGSGGLYLNKISNVNGSKISSAVKSYVGTFVCSKGKTFYFIQGSDLRCYDRDGNVISQSTVSNYSNSIFVNGTTLLLPNGGIVVSDYGKLYFISNNFVLLKTVTLPATTANIFTDNDSLYAIYEAYNTGTVTILKYDEVGNLINERTFANINSTTLNLSHKNIRYDRENKWFFGAFVSLSYIPFKIVEQVKLL